MKYEGLFPHIKNWVNSNTLLNAEEVSHGTLRITGNTKESYIHLDIKYAGVNISVMDTFLIGILTKGNFKI